MRKYIIFLMCLSLLLCAPLMGYSQPEDAEPEEIPQAMPNPMDSTVMPPDPLGHQAVMLPPDPLEHQAEWDPTDTDKVSDDGKHGDGKVVIEVDEDGFLPISKMQSMQDKVMEQSSHRLERGRATRARTQTRSVPANRKP